MMKKLLCMVSGAMDTGGAETFLMKVYREFDRNLYQMDFAVCAKESGSYDEEIKSMGGQIHYVPPKSHGLLKSFKAVYKLVKENQYSYVLRTSQHSLAAMDLLAAKIAGAKVTIYRSSNAGSEVHGIKNLLDRYVFSFMPRLFANVKIAPSTEAAEYVFGKNCIKKGKAVLLHNAVDVDYFGYNEAGRRRIREEFNIGDRFVVGHIGRFDRQKNHDFLLDVFAEVVKKRNDAMLMLVGKGELEQSIKEKTKQLEIQDNVIFTGVRQDISDLLSAMDVFVFPSLYEGMPNAVIEAQANGLNCVVADTITREADITGLVNYLPLNCTPEEWSDVIISSNGYHSYVKDSFIENKYDIGSATTEFIRLIFDRIG